MKALLLAVATLSLVSCMPVDDFGAYWNKAGIDRRLAGRWKSIGDLQDGFALFGAEMSIVENNGAYELTLPANGAKDDVGPLLVKNLRSGRYQFLAVRFAPEKSGFMERYQIRGRVLQLCDESIDEFVSTNYPQAANLRNSGDVGSVMSIGLFDDEVFRILAKIPEMEAWLHRSQAAPSDDLPRSAQPQNPYWYCYDAYQRVR